uniref:Uncharacterized protein n=1 Tax=Steinernema glaseri TaxID=37863 RepID=A0A1I7Y945_9BILA
MHIPFNAAVDVDWERFFMQQAVQNGAGLARPFRGYAYQRGTGLGNVFRSLFRYVMPLITKANVRNEILNAGSRLLGDIAQGEKVGHSIKKNTVRGLKNVVGNLSTKSQEGGRQRKRKRAVSSSSSRAKKRSPAFSARANKVTFL